jgi:hypothetical protein
VRKATKTVFVFCARQSGPPFQMKACADSSPRALNPENSLWNSNFTLSHLAFPFALSLLQTRQYAKGFVPSPAINPKVFVQGQNFRRFIFICQTNQAGVRQINPPVPVFSQESSHGQSVVGQPNGNLKDPGRHVFEDNLRCAAETLQQVTALGDYRLTGDQRRAQCPSCR